MANPVMDEPMGDGLGEGTPISLHSPCFLSHTPTTLDFDIVVDVTTVEQHRGSRHRFVLPVEEAVNDVFWTLNALEPTIAAVDALTTVVALTQTRSNGQLDRV